MDLLNSTMISSFCGVQGQGVWARLNQMLTRVCVCVVYKILTEIAF